MFVNIGTASRRRKGDSVPTGAAATIHACHHSPSRLPSEPPGSLIDQMLGYARHVLAADHTVLFEVDPATNTVANRACSGVLTPAEVSQVDTPLPLSDFLDPAGVEYLLTSTVPSVLERRSPPLHRECGHISSGSAPLAPDRAGAVRIASKLFLEVHYSRRNRMVTAEDIAEAVTLAPMLGSALTSTNLVADNSRLLDESRRAAEALGASEALLRGLIDGLPGYAYQCDADGDTIFTSAQLGTMLGVPQERWRDRPDELWAHISTRTTASVSRPSGDAQSGISDRTTACTACSTRTANRSGCEIANRSYETPTGRCGRGSGSDSISPARSTRAGRSSNQNAATGY